MFVNSDHTGYQSLSENATTHITIISRTKNRAPHVRELKMTNREQLSSISQKCDLQMSKIVHNGTNPGNGHVNTGIARQDTVRK